MVLRYGMHVCICSVYLTGVCACAMGTAGHSEASQETAKEQVLTFVSLAHTKRVGE